MLFEVFVVQEGDCFEMFRALGGVLLLDIDYISTSKIKRTRTITI